MPKTPIDYSRTVIYKIECKDTNVKDIYIGHTTEFRKRKWGHINSCQNVKNKSYNLKIYETIRNNGGWENWDMVEIEKFPCNDGNEARAREKEHYKQLSATLNMRSPYKSNEDNLKLRREYDKKRRNEDNRKNYNKSYLSKWNEEHKELIKEYKRRYYWKNKLNNNLTINYENKAVGEAKTSGCENDM